MTTVLTINDRQQMNRKANASAKSKEVQANTQDDTIAPHLLLRQRTLDTCLQKVNP
jgi:hypothetical protein